MEEKVIIRGVFLKLNIISAIFYCLSAICLYGFIVACGAHATETIIVTLVFTLAFFGLGQLFQYFINKCDIAVTNKRVYGKAAFGKRIDLPLDKISSVGTCAFKGISVSTSSGAIRFLCCKNREDVFKEISNLLIDRQNKSSETVIKQEVKSSDADELKKFKELLDSGVISQEEFDAKKAQLLGL